MTVVNTSIIGNNARRQMNMHNANLFTSSQRLSSGLRINSAKDDSAGLAIANRLSAQINGLSVASRNANDGISMLQTAEGAMDQITNLLMRMRDLSVQAASDNNSSSDRISLQDEITQLRSEVNSIASNTAFGGGLNLLDGTFTSKTLHVGAYQNENLSVSINSAKTGVLGRYSLSSGTASDLLTTAMTASATVSFASTNVTGDDLSIISDTVKAVGTTNSYTVAIDANASAEEIATAVNNTTSSHGVTASAVTKVKIDTLTGAGSLGFELFSGSSTSNTSVTIAPTALTTTDLSGLVSAINAETATTGISAEQGSSAAEVILTHNTGAYIGISSIDGSDGSSFEVTALKADGTESATAITLSDTTGTTVGDSTLVGGEVVFNSAEDFTITEGTADDGLFAATTAQSASLSAISTLDISTQAGANSAIETIDGALKQIDSNRASLGAIMNRLEASSNNALAARENLGQAKSRVVDADFSQEVAEFSKNNILRQSAATMLSQGNANPQLALTLLQSIG